MTQHRFKTTVGLVGLLVVAAGCTESSENAAATTSGADGRATGDNKWPGGRSEAVAYASE